MKNRKSRLIAFPDHRGTVLLDPDVPFERFLPGHRRHLLPDAVRRFLGRRHSDHRHRRRVAFSSLERLSRNPAYRQPAEGASSTNGIMAIRDRAGYIAGFLTGGAAW